MSNISLQACRLFKKQASLGSQLFTRFPIPMECFSTSACTDEPSTGPGFCASGKVQYPHPLQQHASVKQKYVSEFFRKMSSTAEMTLAAAEEACAPHRGHLHAFIEPLLDGYEGVSVLTLNRHSTRNAIGKQVGGRG